MTMRQQIESLRAEALDAKQRHDPANQEGNEYHRCALCNYTRHPCDMHSLATGVLALIHELEERCDNSG